MASATRARHARRDARPVDVASCSSLGDPRLTIVDARPLHAFNGWRTAGEARGGHLPGAISLPSTWLSVLTDDDLSDLLAVKGVTPDAALILYGSGPGEADVLRVRLAEVGFDDVRLYEEWATWAADERRPVDRLPNYERLVHPEWLRDLLDGGRPEAAPARGHLLFHVNFGVPEEYEDSHIPGPSTSTPTGSRTRSTGTVGRRPRSKRRCARSESHPTRRSSSTAGTRKDTRTRSGQDVAQARSRPHVLR